jgi:hypothetical protein
VPASSPNRNDLAYFMIQQLVGSSKWGHFFWTVLLLTAFGVVVNSISNLLGEAAKGLGWASWPEDVIIVIAFAGLVWWLRSGASKHEQDYAPHVVSDSDPAVVRAVILYLSPADRPGSVENRQIIEEIIRGETSTEADTCLLANPGFIQRSDVTKLTWRMPLGAIDHHKSRLTHVVVIASADRNSGNSQSRGTIHDVPLFKQFIESVGRPATGQPCRFKVLGLAQLLESCNDESLKSRANDFINGVDFENVRELGEATVLSFNALSNLDVGAKETVVDVTGGQKPPTIAGTLVSQAEGRRIQYVSTHGYKVMTYDITYAI